VLRQPTPYAAHDAAPNHPKNADLGALTPKQRQLQACPTECPAGSVGYCNGIGFGTETCGEDCCTGNSACLTFSGCVKKDGSCSGDYACTASKVSIIENSCKGPYSCGYIMGYSGGNSVGAVIDSCNADNACFRIGYYGTMESTITKSCNGYMACSYMGYADSGSVGPIEDSCNREKACLEVAMYQSIKSITKTCNNDAHKPCAILSSAGKDHFNFGHLTKFVHAETGEKYKRDSIGSIEDCHDACVNDIDCNGIKWKEHTGRPCRFFGGPISDNKCNGRNVCITVE
jgi:hypothetical protein